VILSEVDLSINDELQTTERMKTDCYLLSRTVSKLWLIIIANEDRLLNTTITCNYDFPISNSSVSDTDNDNCWWCQNRKQDCLL